MLDRIAVFISKNGADLQCIIDACADHQIRGAIDIVISSSSDAVGLKRADNAGILNIFFDRSRFETQDDFYRFLSETLEQRGIDWILMIEYEDIVPQWFLDRFKGRTISCHPYVKPKLLGQEHAGLRLAKLALDHGDETSGCTIFHYTVSQDDFGEIIAQEHVPIFNTDSQAHLYNRIKKVEHYLIPKVFAKLCSK